MSSVTPTWGMPMSMIDEKKLEVRLVEKEGDSKIYEVFLNDEECEEIGPQTYFSLAEGDVVYSQISPARAVTSTKFHVTKKTAKLCVKLDVTNTTNLEFVQQCIKKLLSYAEEELDLDSEEIKIWNLKKRGKEDHFVCNRNAYTKSDSGFAPTPIRVWKKANKKVSLTPVCSLIRSSVHVSVNFILIVGKHTGIKSTFLKDVLLKKIQKREKFDAAALDFFGEFEDTTDTTPKKRPHGDIGTSTTNTRGRKRR
eukprot:g287.t1